MISTEANTTQGLTMNTNMTVADVIQRIADHTRLFHFFMSKGMHNIAAIHQRHIDTLNNLPVKR